MLTERSVGACVSSPDNPDRNPQTIAPPGHRWRDAYKFTGRELNQSINQSIIVLAITNITIYRLCQKNKEQYQKNRFDTEHT